MERENLKPVLPTTLSLRREAEEVLNTVAEVRREEDVREIVLDLNERIRESRRRSDGPPVWVHTVDVERVVREWRERRGQRG
jgi:hypothetical protein